MNIYKWIYLGLMGIELLFQVRKHGSARSDYHFGNYLLSVALFFGLMIPGGFFK